MSDNKLKFTIRSRDGDGDRLRLDDLADELSHIYKVLAKMDHIVSRKRHATMHFQVTELKYSSPNNKINRLIKALEEIIEYQPPGEYESASQVAKDAIAEIKNWGGKE